MISDGIRAGLHGEHSGVKMERGHVWSTSTICNIGSGLCMLIFDILDFNFVREAHTTLRTQPQPQKLLVTVTRLVSWPKAGSEEEKVDIGFIHMGDL